MRFAPVQNVFGIGFQPVGAQPGRRLVFRDFVEQNKFAGVCIDFEEPKDETQPALLQFMRELHAAFQPKGWLVAQAAPFNDDKWNYREYSAACDYLMLMAYDEHWHHRGQLYTHLRLLGKEPPMLYDYGGG